MLVTWPGFRNRLPTTRRHLPSVWYRRQDSNLHSPDSESGAFAF